MCWDSQELTGAATNLASTICHRPNNLVEILLDSLPLWSIDIYGRTGWPPKKLGTLLAHSLQNRCARHVEVTLTTRCFVMTLARV